MKFLDKFNKTIEKIEGVSTHTEPPRYFHSSGNKVADLIISGRALGGGILAQGRITGFAGPSGAGKSFLLSNTLREAQKDGAIILAIDSENALDSDFVSKIGVDPNPPKFNYVSVVTIPQVTKVISSFLDEYRQSYKNDLENAPKVVIAIDSLDMLMTDTEVEHYSKGNTRGDQGQRNKQLKAMLRTLVQDIKELNVAIACTSQVYVNQDPLNGEGRWIVSEAVKYSMSIIALLTKLKLRGSGVSKFEGIRLRVNGYKTRFTKPFQQIEIEVPYESGMNPYSGVIEVGVELGVLERAGSRYRFVGEDKTFFAKDFTDEMGDITLAAIDEILRNNNHLAIEIDTGLEEDGDDEKRSSKKKREEKAREVLHG